MKKSREAMSLTENEAKMLGDAFASGNENFIDNTLALVQTMRRKRRMVAIVEEAVENVLERRRLNGN